MYAVEINYYSMSMLTRDIHRYKVVDDHRMNEWTM